MTTVALIPCAGKSERLYGLPKYLLPLEDGYLLKNACEQIINTINVKVHIGVNNENYPFVSPFAPKGTNVYRMVTNTRTMVETLRFLRDGDNNVIMAMPDTYWTPDPNLFPQMINMLDVADVVLGCWHQRYSQRGKLGTVEVNGDNVLGVIDKDPKSPHICIWGCVAWKPIFWNYMKPEHPHLGIAVNEAIAAGLKARAVFSSGDYYDCGTFLGYAELVQSMVF